MMWLPIAIAVSIAYAQEEERHQESAARVEKRLEALETAMAERDGDLEELKDLTKELLQAVGYTEEQAEQEMATPIVLGPECVETDTGIACGAVPEEPQPEPALEAIPVEGPEAPAID